MKTIISFLLFFAIISIAKSQTPNLNLDVYPQLSISEGEVGTPYTYRASLIGGINALPVGSVIDRWEWEVQHLGSNGSVNGQASLPFISASTRKYIDNTASTVSSVSIVWSEQEVPLAAFVTGALYYTPPNTTIIRRLDAAFPSFYINDVCPPSVRGNTSIQQCCQTPQTYTASNYCDADDFIWTVPSGWTIQSG